MGAVISTNRPRRPTEERPKSSGTNVSEPTSSMVVTEVELAWLEFETVRPDLDRHGGVRQVGVQRAGDVREQGAAEPDVVAVPARGRGASDRADACWLPIAKGLTPHGLRHTHRTMMEDLGTEKVLMDERMGHIDGSVSARYAHVTVGMRRRLMGGLTEQWEGALGARLAMCPTSPVRV
jgi:hypothetical protein